MKNTLLSIWKENHPLVAAWLYLLLLTFGIGFVSLLYGMISGQVDFSNATFGIFDYV